MIDMNRVGSVLKRHKVSDRLRTALLARDQYRNLAMEENDEDVSHQLYEYANAAADTLQTWLYFEEAFIEAWHEYEPGETQTFSGENKLESALELIRSQL